MPEPTISIATKNDYFNYVKIDGATAAFRQLEQVWNARGISMKVQGTSWDGNGVNGFGKRHLLSTTGSTKDVAQKANSILMKRGIKGLGSTGRAKKQKQILNTMVPVTDFQTKEGSKVKSFDKAGFSNAQKSAKTRLDSVYSTGLYGPSTEICTFVKLDGYSPTEIKEAFAQDIIDAGPWTDGNEKTVILTFADPIVIDVDNKSSTNYYRGMSVSVKFYGGIYHIFHCNGGVNPT
ncbi:MAG: hypothetical protein WDN49_10330 [Acetobacteraceae bacterium]